MDDKAFVLLKLEISVSAVAFAIRRSHEKGLQVLLNPALAQVLAPELLECLYLITPNESEAELLT